VRGNSYKERAIVEKFKRGINRVIRRKLMEAKDFQLVLNSGINMLLI